MRRVFFDKLKDESCWSCGWNGKSIEREVLFESYEVDEFVEVDEFLQEI